jgi:hypothetical protein
MPPAQRPLIAIFMSCDVVGSSAHAGQVTGVARSFPSVPPAKLSRERGEIGCRLRDAHGVDMAPPVLR